MNTDVCRIDYGKNRNGEVLLRRQWVPSGPPRALVLVIHGIAEHSGRYGGLGARLAAAGFGVVAYDQRGHGASEGRKGHIDKFNEFVDDVEDQLAELRRVGVPVVLLGHSMGGLVAATHAVSERAQADLLVLSGPALGVGVPQWQQFLVHKISQLAPKFHPPLPFDPAVLSRDPAVGAAFSADPLIKGGGSVNLISQLISTAEQTSDRIEQLRIPTLCLHGGDDVLVPTQASAVLEGVGGVERRVLAGLRHEIFNEPEGPQVIDEVIAWIVSNLAGLQPN